MVLRSDEMIRFLILFEAFIFTFAYLFGTHGIREIAHYNQEAKKLDEEIAHIQTEIGELERQLVCWQKDFFYAEKIARQELQMARPDEIVYMIS